MYIPDMLHKVAYPFYLSGGNMYHKLSNELIKRIEDDRSKGIASEYAAKDEDIIRRNPDHDIPSLWRPAYLRDIEKILHNPYYNRYSDKTQVFSFVKNDDVSRRALHVQLVSRTARNIGRVLGLNLDLIEAAALGHDIGHTPFGHAGERFLSELYREHTGRLFNHNVHSVRVLDKLIRRNMSLQVLDGVLSHNGELELKEYRPASLPIYEGDGSLDSKRAYSAQCFDKLDERVEACITDPTANKKQIPCTLEGCVVRVSDIIAYLGKDRQDAIRLGVLESDKVFSGSENIGTSNPEIINNMIVNIIENSYGKPYLKMDDEYFEAFSAAKKENYSLIYNNEGLEELYATRIKPMFSMMYERLVSEFSEIKKVADTIEDISPSLLSDDEKTHAMGSVNERLLVSVKDAIGDSEALIHHIGFLVKENYYNANFSLREYLSEPADAMTVDYIASMTDDYFIDYFERLFPESGLQVPYRSYFG